MAIASVRVQVNGTWHTLTYNSGTGAYEAQITAPGATSFHQSGGYYNVTVEATNDAGTKVTADAASLDSLRLFVRETVPPVITILSPSNGAYVSNSKQPVVFTVTDEQGGSGVDLDSLEILVDGTPADASGAVFTAVTNGYSVTYTPSSVLSDGPHTVTVRISDNDGNSAAEKSTTYTVDTIPPTLNIIYPADGFITNTAALLVRGTTNDATSSPVTVSIRLNGADQGAVSVGADGSFSKQITLAEGDNTIIVEAVDAAGKVSSVTRTVRLDTSVPTVQSATITPNPADTGASVIISVVIA